MITIKSKADRFFVPLFTFKLQSFKDIHWLKITGKCRDRRRHKDCESEQCVGGRTESHWVTAGSHWRPGRSQADTYSALLTPRQVTSQPHTSHYHNLTISNSHILTISHHHILTISLYLSLTIPHLDFLISSQSHNLTSSKALSLTISQHRHHIRLLISLCFQALFSSHMFSSPSAPSPCLMYRDKMLGMSLVSSK